MLLVFESARRRDFHAKNAPILRLSTASTGVWKGAKKNSFEVLDIAQSCSKITNGSALPKSVEPCRGFTVGSEVIQGTDPIVRRLISTG